MDTNQRESQLSKLQNFFNLESEGATLQKGIDLLNMLKESLELGYSLAIVDDNGNVIVPFEAPKEKKERHLFLLPPLPPEDIK